ncbi:uncharacterized protein DS421_1g26910 [Arachis hypogaea]|nr:uncharacterized protein DS421_1g26910 [Arachis hypogaea]
MAISNITRRKVNHILRKTLSSLEPLIRTPSLGAPSLPPPDPTKTSLAAVTWSPSRPHNWD